MARSPEGDRAGPQVCLKISEFGLRDQPWEYESNRRIVLEAIEVFGIDRCMFASNLPVCTLRASFGTIVDGVRSMVADFSREDQERLFSRNAAASTGSTWVNTVSRWTRERECTCAL
jgi:predicted TIM-barrel fold metal-dependent hydrolase